MSEKINQEKRFESTYFKFCKNRSHFQTFQAKCYSLFQNKMARIVTLNGGTNPYPPPFPLTPWVLSTAPSEKRAKPFLDKHPDKLQVKRAPEMQRNNETDEVHGLQRGALSAMS